MDWDEFDGVLKAAREEALAEADKLFAEFSAKHDAHIAELRAAMAEHDQKMDELFTRLANNQPIKDDIEKMLADMRAQ